MSAHSSTTCTSFVPHWQTTNGAHLWHFEKICLQKALWVCVAVLYIYIWCMWVGLTCEDDDTRDLRSSAHTGPHHASQDDMISSNILELDSKHKEKNDSARGSSDVDDMALMHARLLLRKQWWALFRPWMQKHSQERPSPCLVSM